MEMEPAAAWGPYCEFQLANWTVDEPVAEGWAPAAVLPDPLEYASIDIDIFGACCGLQAPVPASIGVGGQQLVDYFSVDELRGELISVKQEDIGVRKPTKELPNIGEPTGNTDIITDNDGSRASGSGMFEQALSEFETEINLMEQKMHRYPASLRYTIDTWCKVPRFVAIGPYHHHQPHLKQEEKVKVVATICYVKDCGDRWQEMYNAVASVADAVRCLYEEDVMEGISSVDFQCMMFVDACFLVQFMRMQSNPQKVVIDQSLHASLSPNRTDILHDVMLLENQLPWALVQRVKEFLPATTSFLPDLISTLRGCLQDHKPDAKDRVPVDWAEGYKPPHLLGLLRYYIAGRTASWNPQVEDDQSHGHRNKGKEGHKPKTSNKRSVSQSAVQLAKIGIKLIPTKKTTELIHMGLNAEAGILHGELSLPPLSLNLDRASYLVNMAALEMCMVPSFGAARDEDSVVCSYLLLLAMLAYREEDVHELRERGLLQGGGGLTNEDALRFFTSLQCLRLGKSYIRIMDHIESFKEKRTKTATFNELWYDNKKTIATVFGAVVSMATIVGTLVSIKTAL